MHYYEVAPISLVRSDATFFTYASSGPLEVGQIVVVPVGKKSVVGVVLKESKQPDFAVKEVATVINEPPIPTELLATAQWMSEYYFTHFSQILSLLVPRGITKKRRELNTKIIQNARTFSDDSLTADQQTALKKISEANGTILLRGVTGSGKTRIYVEAAKRAQQDGKSAIILVPEISLTPQLVAEFQHHFGTVIVTHSQQTEAERHQIWQQAARANGPIIVIGPRSALFMPVHSLGLIVIDESHEPSYKQEKSPRYTTSHVASFLAKQHNAKLILGSATPNIVDYYQAEQANLPIITIEKPARANVTPPKVSIIDTTKRGNFSKHRFLSDHLLSAIEQTLAQKNQVLLFHNRRGTTPITLCEQCGWQAGCPRCFVPLTLHADTHKMLCHICGNSYPVPTACPECGNASIIHKGIGTKLIETEVKKLFPNKKIVRFDKDTSSNERLENTYADVYSGDVDIIIGTQVIAKGLDLPHLRTVGVIQADAGLMLPDFAASERTFQLLCQVVGRVGRDHQETEVIVQSYQPNHPAVVDGTTQNFVDFYERTKRQRESANFPPFVHLLKLICIYKTEATAIKNAKKLTETLKGSSLNIEILGPTPAFYERVGDTFRWQLVIKAKKRSELLKTLRFLPQTHWQYELDPINLL